MAKADTADKLIKGDKPAKSGKPGRGVQAAKPSLFARLAQYFRDVRTEMKRVVWPTREEVKNMFLVVVVTLMFFSVFTWLVDTAVVALLGLVGKIG